MKFDSLICKYSQTKSSLVFFPLPLLKCLCGCLYDFSHLLLALLQLLGQFLVEVLKHSPLPPQVINVLTELPVDGQLLVEVHHRLKVGSYSKL